MSNSHEHAGHNHDRTHGMAKQSLRLAFFLTMLILAAELIGGFAANSLALLSDAGHVVTDIFALGLAWFAIVQAERPANARKTFGYHRLGILAAFVNALTLIVIALVILWEAIQRFQHPEPVQPLVMFLAAGVFGDVGASAAVIVAGIIILLTGWTIADPILSVGIAVLIGIGAWRILRETIDILMESVPKDISMSNLVDDMVSVDGVQEVHDLHVWSIANNMHALSCHALIKNLPPSDSSAILQSLNAMLSEKYRITHTTIQFECDAYQGKCCEMDGLYCRMQAAKDLCNGHSHDHESDVLELPPRKVLVKRNGAS